MKESISVKCRIEIESGKKTPFILILIFILTFLIFAFVVRYFSVYRLIVRIQPKEMESFSKLMDSIHNLYGDLVEVSELKQTENAVLKKMYLQINFEKFSDLIQFYCILFIVSLICSFFFIFSITIIHSFSIVLFV